METKTDRFARAIRPLVWVMCIVALPVFLFSYVHMIVAFYHSQGAIVFIGVGLCHMIVWIAAAMLHDHQRESR